MHCIFLTCNRPAFNSASGFDVFQKCPRFDPKLEKVQAMTSEDATCSTAEKNHTCLDGLSMSERCEQQSSSESLDKNVRHHLLKLVC